MKSLTLISFLMMLLVSCSNKERQSTYQTLKEKTGIAEILQSDDDVKDAKDICVMADLEINLRFEYILMTLQGKIEKDQNKLERYGEEIIGIVNSKLLSEKTMNSIFSRTMELSEIANGNIIPELSESKKTSKSYY